MISQITNEVMKKAKLTDCFNILYPIAEAYVLNRCFEVQLKDIGNEKLRKTLKEISIQEAISGLLAIEIGKATAEKKKVTVKGSLLYHQKHLNSPGGVSISNARRLSSILSQFIMITKQSLQNSWMTARI